MFYIFVCAVSKKGKVTRLFEYLWQRVYMRKGDEGTLSMTFISHVAPLVIRKDPL